MHRPGIVSVVTAAGLALAGCSSSAQDTTGQASDTASVNCSKESLQTMKSGVLVVATGQPAYEPWVVDNSPQSGQGFEAAVALAAAEELGYSAADIQWVRTTFDGAIAPGEKSFDWNLQQFSVTEDREKAVDFSSSYYDVNQAIVSYSGSPIAQASSISDLASAKLGAAVGSTSLVVAQELGSSEEVAVFNDNAAAVSALKNQQIDGIVVDLPTAFYLAAAEIDDGVIVGQVPSAEGDTTDSFGILLANNSPLTTCTTQAVDALRADGTLAELEREWLGTDAGAPVLQ